jgi:hypothetical protein
VVFADQLVPKLDLLRINDQLGLQLIQDGWLYDQG